jgi:hypothetical protein
MTKSISNFECASLSVSTLQVKRLNADRQEELVEFDLVLDMNAISHANSILGLDLTDRSQWQDLTGPDITVICWCAFDRFYPDVTLTEVRQMLTPAQSAGVCNLLLEMCFPGILELIRKRMAELALEEKEKEAGQAQTADPTSAGKS